MIDPGTNIQTLTYERGLHAHGLRAVAGVDEVGRGALAGPLVAAAVILPTLDEIERDADFWSQVRDSKTLTFARREVLAGEITRRVRTWCISAVEPDELDHLGVGPANRIVMERSVLGLDLEPDMLLIDAMTIESGVPHIGIIDGDALSLSIAAASIIAKVERDTHMIHAEPTWPAYGFARHKGYSVPSHIAALRAHGPCDIHRRCFAPVRLALEHRDAAET
jgi:ribonuclease HII